MITVTNINPSLNSTSQVETGSRSSIKENIPDIFSDALSKAFETKLISEFNKDDNNQLLNGDGKELESEDKQISNENLVYIPMDASVKTIKPVNNISVSYPIPESLGIELQKEGANIEAVKIAKNGENLPLEKFETKTKNLEVKTPSLPSKDFLGVDLDSNLDQKNIDSSRFKESLISFALNDSKSSLQSDIVTLPELLKQGSFFEKDFEDVKSNALGDQGLELIKISTPITNERWSSAFAEKLSVSAYSLVQKAQVETNSLELGDRISFIATQQIQKAQIEINPPHLGPIQVQVSIEDGEAQLNFLTQHQSVKEVIQAALPKLNDMFFQVGMDLSQVNVNVGQQSQFTQQHSHKGNQSSTFILENQEEGLEIKMESINKNSSLSQALDLFV